MTTSERINILVIEDEEAAFNMIKRMLSDSELDISLVARLKSVKESIKWLKKEEQPDLILLDIQLGDGLSFKIFESVEIDCAIIFTTAFDQYALKAFELHSIDYLLKPFSQEQLDNALKKYQRWNLPHIGLRGNMHQLIEQYANRSFSYKERFHVKKGKRIYIIKCEDIAWFCKGEYVYLMTTRGDKFYLDYTLDQIINDINPKQFYRINRQVIANIEAITRIDTHFNYKLKITLSPTLNEEVFVAKDKAKRFKEWLG